MVAEGGQSHLSKQDTQEILFVRASLVAFAFDPYIG